jgi:hypothetical protein
MTDKLGNLYATRPLPAGTTYEIVLLRSQLRRFTNVPVGGDPEAVRTQYLQLPPLPGRLIARCRQAVAGETDRLKVVTRLRDLVQAGKQYSLDPTRLPPGREAVDYFLFDMKQGACTQYATALAVCCRVAGIPARIVTGFGPGTYNPNTQLHEVRERDSHAWVQVWFPDLGWLDFDPTPAGAAPNLARTAPQPRDTLQEQYARVRAAALRLWDRTRDRARVAARWLARHRMWPVYALGATVAAAVALLVGRRALRRLAWWTRWLASARGRPRDAVAESYRCCLEWMRRRGVRVDPAMTPTEIVGEVRNARLPWAEDFHAITRDTEHILFGEAETDRAAELRERILRLRGRFAEKPADPAPARTP